MIIYAEIAEYVTEKTFKMYPRTCGFQNPSMKAVQYGSEEKTLFWIDLAKTCNPA